VFAALVLCSGLILVAGRNPLTAYSIMFAAALGSGTNIAETLVRAAPLIFTGLAVAVAFRAKFWNIGAEGQLLAGAVAAAWIGALTLPGLLGMIGIGIAGAIGGAAIALIPAALRVFLKVDDVVSSLLMNSIVFYLMTALIEGPWKDPFSGYPISGALAGLAGAGEVGGVHYQVMADLSPGFGYSGIVVAMLARLHPLGVLPAALFLATVMTGAEAMARATGIPAFLADVIQGTALLTMLVALLFTSYRLRRTARPP
jgi:simple sugar transport system permease protein